MYIMYNVQILGDKRVQLAGGLVRKGLWYFEIKINLKIFIDRNVIKVIFCLPYFCLLNPA